MNKAHKTRNNEKKERGFWGAGIQCHAQEFVVKNERLRNIISLVCSKKEEEEFWDKIEKMRKGVLSILPVGELAIIHHRDVTPSSMEAVVGGIKDIEKIMFTKGFIGFMLPEGVLVVSKKKKYIFEKFCHSLGVRM